MITEDLNTEFWVISDTHLIAKSLHDEGQAFSQMQKTSQGKDLYYQETALTAFMRMAQRKKPATIITGDITFNGERVSAEKFAEIFKPLKHTQVLVLPGNHDIFDGWAREFRGKKQFYAGEISPMFWRSIFAKSYRQAFNTNDSSLAYSVQLNPQYFLILADSNIYGTEETTPTSEVVTSSFCSNDQGYGVVRVHSRHITYVRRNFDMTRYLTDQEKENYTLEHFHKYLKDLQLGSIPADMMQSELNKIHSSQAHQLLIKHHPEYRLYLETLYDTTSHSNLQVKIRS